MPDAFQALRSLSPERVCLIKPSSLGDVVHTFPTLLALRDHWPTAKISWVINKSLRGLVDGHPAIDEVIPFDRSAIKASLRGVSRFVGFLADLRRRRFDLAIDAQGLLRSGMMTWATGARWRVGLAEAREGATRFYTHSVPSTVGVNHAVERSLRLAEAFGASTDPKRFQVAMNDQDLDWADRQLANVARPCVVINPGARWLTKRWPPRHFAEIARRAVLERGAGIVAVGAPEDLPLIDAIREELGSIPLLDLCGRTTLPQLAAIARTADLFLSNDTGPLHLATATGARAVGIYLCTNPQRTGPYGDNAVTVQSCVWCAPSYVRKCNRLECMVELSPDRVWPTVAQQLASAASGRSEAA